MASTHLLDVMMKQAAGGRSFLRDVSAINEATARRKRENAANILLREASADANKEAEDQRITEALSYADEDQREALRAQVAATPNATIVGNKVYAGEIAGQKAHEDMLRQKAKDDAIAKNAGMQKLLADQRDLELADINRKKAAFANGDAAKAMGLDPADIDEKTISAAQANLDKIAADIEAKYQAALAQPAPADEAGKATLAALQKQAGGARELADGLRGVSNSYGEKYKTFHQGVDADSADLLEQMMIDNPYRQPSDPRRFDRAREQSIQRSMPNLVAAAKVDPVGARLLMDQYKMDSKQGDAGIDAERKSYNAMQKERMGILSKLKTLSDTSARLKNQKEQFEQELAHKKAILAEKARRNTNDKEYQDAKIQVEVITNLLDNVTKKQIAVGHDAADLYGRASTSQNFWTNEGRQYISDVVSTMPNGSNAANFQNVMEGIRQMFLPKVGQAQENPPKRLEAKAGPEKLIGKSDNSLQGNEELAPAPMPTIVTDANAKAAKKAKKGAKASRSAGIYDPESKAAYQRLHAKGKVSMKVNPDGTSTFTTKSGESFTFRDRK